MIEEDDADDADEADDEDGLLWGCEGSVKEKVVNIKKEEE